MKFSKTTNALGVFVVTVISCSEAVPQKRTTFFYKGPAPQQGFGVEDSGVTTCSLAGTESHVAIATLISSTWEKRVCGEKLPDSRFRYVVEVSTPILDSKKGELELLGQQSFTWLPKSAKAGDKFLIGYRTARGENFLLQWAEMIEGETNTTDRVITLPPTVDELTAQIQQMRGSNCKTNYIGFESPFENFIQPWHHTECGGYLEKITEPPINNGVDK